MKLLSVREYGI